MRIGVLAYDSRAERPRHGSLVTHYPNLAAAAIVDGHRQAGHDVIWPWTEGIAVDQLWVSVIYTWSRPAVLAAMDRWTQWAGEIVLGGTGWEVSSQLPAWLANPAPGYVERTYPEFCAGIGFTLRGCPGRCPWCVVPRKEGSSAYRVARIPDLLHSQSRHLVLLNNNWLADRDAFMEDAEDLIRLGCTVDANQANDITLVDDVNAPVLARLRFRNFSGRRCMRFAFDSLRKTAIDPASGKPVFHDMSRVVPEKVRLLKDHGVAPSSMFWYMLVGHNTTQAEDLERFEILRSLGCGGVFVMRYRDIRGRGKDVDGRGRLQGPWVKHLQRWINGHAWRRCAFSEFQPWKDAMQSEFINYTCHT